MAASVQELIALADHENRARNPGVGAVQNLLAGLQHSQQGGLDRTIKLMQMDQMRREQEQQAQMDAQIRGQLEGQREGIVSQAHKGVAGPGLPVLPVQKLKMEISQDEKGRYSRKFVSEDTKPADSLDALLAREVQSGKLTLEEAIEKKAKSQGVSPSLAYTKEKDAKKEALDMQELQIPGYDLTGEVRPLPTEAKNLRDTVAQTKNFLEGLDQMESLIKKHGGTELTGTASGEMGALAANLKLKLKEVDKLGVLSASDIAFLDAQITDPSSLRSLGTRTPTILSQLKSARERAEASLSKATESSGYKVKGGGGTEAEERKSVGGKTYVKVNGEWFEE